MSAKDKLIEFIQGLTDEEVKKITSFLNKSEKEQP